MQTQHCAPQNGLQLTLVSPPLICLVQQPLGKEMDFVFVRTHLERNAHLDTVEALE